MEPDKKGREKMKNSEYQRIKKKMEKVFGEVRADMEEIETKLVYLKKDVFMQSKTTLQICMDIEKILEIVRR